MATGPETAPGQRKKTELLDSRLKKLAFLFVSLVLGFVGGYGALIWSTYFKPINISSLSDAIAIANTYIVYTTLIFVGFTVAISLLSYIFIQQVSGAKEVLINQITDELRDRIQKDYTYGQSFINEALKNRDVLRFIEDKINDKIGESLSHAQNGAAQAAQKAQADVDAIAEIRASLKKEPE